MPSDFIAHTWEFVVRVTVALRCAGRLHDRIANALGVFGIIVAGSYRIVGDHFDSESQKIELNRRDIELIRKEFLTLREFIAYQREIETATSAFRSRIAALEGGERELIAHAARSPVEAKEVDVLSAAIDKRFEATQQQINDINRQIAASILQPGYAHQPTPPH